MITFGENVLSTNKHELQWVVFNVKIIATKNVTLNSQSLTDDAETLTGTYFVILYRATFQVCLRFSEKKRKVFFCNMYSFWNSRHHTRWCCTFVAVLRQGFFYNKKTRFFLICLIWMKLRIGLNIWNQMITYTNFSNTTIGTSIKRLTAQMPTLALRKTERHGLPGGNRL